MQYLTRKQLQKIDRLATDKYGIPSIILMENAGRAAAEETIKLIHNKTARIIVICGKGNNGGDGFVIARHLHNNHYKVSVIYLGHIKDRKSRSAASDINLNIVRELGIPIYTLNKKVPRLLNSADIIIDAIFGIGLTREIQSPLKELIAQINALNKPVLAADIPSGLDTDTGKPLGIAIKAKLTVTFGYPKIGFKNKESGRYTGKVIVVDISLPTNGRTKGLKD
ncbi:MAG TPA: NAD(P)H-hydrate epimerase [Planctomycetota bacterium]|nr:NAD(P)H-hydrate epimerase [Planctomycetota bacterium]